MSVPWYLMAKGKGWGGYKTASGPIVSVNDALAAPLRSLLVNIDPVQAGTGDPSPDNVRPISGWTEANVWDSADNNVWSRFKTVLDSGLAGSMYPVGKQITDRWYKNAGTYYDAPWDIVHYDSSGNAYLKWHYTWPDAFAFDEPEAIYYFDGTEEAGVEYYILIKTAYGNGWASNAGIAFTLTDTPEAGDQLVLATATNANTDPTNVTWKVYDAGGTTVKQTGTTSSSTTGTKLGETSSSGVGYTNGRVNAPHRVVYGYGRWSQSAMRQWMNSALGAGAWWSPQNPWDRPPAVAATIRGFMAGLSLDFLSIVEKTTVTTALNTVEGLQEDRETTEDYFFLPSLQEMYISPQLADAEGVDWDYFKELAADAGLSGKFATSGTYAELITYNLSNTSSPVVVRLRSAYRGYTYGAWLVYGTGYVNSSGAYSGYRGCPACKIRKSALDPNKEKHIAVTWQSTAGTVYGGTLDVTNGVLTVDRYFFSNKFKNINTSETKSGYVKKNQNLNVIAIPDISRKSEALFNIVPYVQSDAESNFPCGYISNEGGLNFWLPESQDEETVLECCYPLATPITIPLTPQEISTLKGANNLWADTGDVTVEYLSAGGADPDLMKLAVAFMGRE